MRNIGVVGAKGERFPAQFAGDGVGGAFIYFKKAESLGGGTETGLVLGWGDPAGSRLRNIIGPGFTVRGREH